MFLPDEQLGQGLSVQEYAHIAELLAEAPLHPMCFNCNAPDSGNMELIWRYGNDAQKTAMVNAVIGRRRLPVFGGMTEPAVASSDATNMQFGATAIVEGDEIVLNGRKWWSSGLGDPNAKLIILWHIPQMRVKIATISTPWYWYL